MIATLEGKRNAVAERPQDFCRPGSQRDHDMARRNLTIGQHNAPTIAVRRDRLDIRLPDIAAGAGEHPRIGLDHLAWRVDRSGLRVQHAHFIDGHDTGLERGDGLAVKQFAGDAVFGQQRLFLLRRRDRIAAPRPQPARFANAMPRFRFHDPFPVQFRGSADQTMQGGRPRPETRRCRIGQKTHDPSRVLNRPYWIPAQRGVAVGQVFRQRLPQRRIIERRYRAAADDAGIAIGGLAARLAPVDENDRHPALSCSIGR